MDFSTEPVFDAFDFDTKESLLMRRRHAAWVLNTLKTKAALNKYGAYLRRIGRIPPRKRRRKVIDVEGSKVALAARLAGLDDTWFDIFRGEKPVYVSTRDWAHAREFRRVEELPHGTPWHVAPQIQEILRRGGRIAGLVGCKRRHNRFQFPVPDGSVRVYIGMRYNFWRNTNAWNVLSDIAPKTEDICYHAQSNVQAHHRTRTSATSRNGSAEHSDPNSTSAPASAPASASAFAPVSAPASAPASIPAFDLTICPTPPIESDIESDMTAGKRSCQSACGYDSGTDTGTCSETEKDNDDGRRSHLALQEAEVPSTSIPRCESAAHAYTGDAFAHEADSSSNDGSVFKHDVESPGDGSGNTGHIEDPTASVIEHAKRAEAQTADAAAISTRCAQRPGVARKRKRKECSNASTRVELNICLP